MFNNKEDFSVVALFNNILRWGESTFLHCLNDYFHVVWFKMLEEKTFWESFLDFKFCLFGLLNYRWDKVVLFIPISIDLCWHSLSSSLLLRFLDNLSLLMEILFIFLTLLLSVILFPILLFQLIKILIVFLSQMSKLLSLVLIKRLTRSGEFVKNWVDCW